MDTEMEMDVETVMELGTVSEETAGHSGQFEGGVDPNSGNKIG